jgi:peptidoglycan DL-endopeptidase LytE
MIKEARMKSVYLFITTLIVAVFIFGSSYAAVTHKVKKGDTIRSLSKKYSLSEHELKAMNNLKSSKLKIGQKLTIKQTDPTEYKVRKGDTVWNIARRFNIDPDELIEINSLETDSLRPGQRILVKHAAEPKESKHYEAILSQAHEEVESEQISEHQKAMVFGLQEKLILFAKKMLNIPYQFGGNSPLGIDCSAYVKKVYSLIGVDLPRSAREQFNEGIPVEENNLSIGDLVFFRTYASYPSHVGIYLGNNLFIHASSKSKKVTIDSLDTPFYLKRFIGAKRLLDMSAKSQASEIEG